MVCQYRLAVIVSSLPAGGNERPHACSGTQSNSLDHVRCPPHATIDEQLELLVRKTQSPSRLQLPRHLDEDLDARPSKVELATTVVRKHNSGQPSIIGFQGILVREMSEGFAKQVALHLPPNIVHPSGSMALGDHDMFLNLKPWEKWGTTHSW